MDQELLELQRKFKSTGYWRDYRNLIEFRRKLGEEFNELYVIFNELALALNSVKILKDKILKRELQRRRSIHLIGKYKKSNIFMMLNPHKNIILIFMSHENEKIDLEISGEIYKFSFPISEKNEYTENYLFKTELAGTGQYGKLRIEDIYDYDTPVHHSAQGNPEKLWEMVYHDFMWYVNAYYEKII